MIIQTLKELRSEIVNIEPTLSLQKTESHEAEAASEKPLAEVDPEEL